MYVPHSFSFIHPFAFVVLPIFIEMEEGKAEAAPGGPQAVEGQEAQDPVSESSVVVQLEVLEPKVSEPKVPEPETGTTQETKDEKKEDKKDEKKEEPIDWCWRFWCFMPDRWGPIEHKIVILLRLFLAVTIFVLSTYAYHNIRFGEFEIGPSFPPLEPTAIKSPSCVNSTGDNLILSLGCAPSDDISDGAYHYGCKLAATPSALLYELGYAVIAYIFFSALAIGLVTGFVPYFIFFLPLLVYVGFLRLGYEKLVVDTNVFSWCLLRNGYVDHWGDVFFRSFPVLEFDRIITKPACQITINNPAEKNNILTIIENYQCTGAWYDSSARKTFVNILPNPVISEQFKDYYQRFGFYYDVSFYLVFLSFLIVDIPTIKLLFTKPWKEICHFRGRDNCCQCRLS
jgi:hypothetical protein